MEKRFGKSFLMSVSVIRLIPKKNILFGQGVCIEEVAF